MRGERIPYKEAKKKDNSDKKGSNMWKAYALAAVLAVVFNNFVMVLLSYKTKKEKEESKEKAG